MDRIWAPWRIDYVSQKKQAGCVFCRAYKKREDKKRLVVLRSRHCFIILNTFPYNNGHLMVATNRHVAGLERLTGEEVLDINKTMIKAMGLLKKALRPQGFNVGINIGKLAGAGVDKHLHIHIVPRWAGDTNFMPVLASTKIISQSLKDLYGKLRKAARC